MAFTPIWLERLEDRLTLSQLGVHHATQVGHLHDAARVGHHDAAHVRHHDVDHVRDHHHGAHIHKPQSGSISTGAGTNPTTTGTNPTTTGTTPPTTGTTPPTTGTMPPNVTVVLNGKIEGRTPLDGSGKFDSLGAVTTRGTLSASGAEPMTYTGKVSLVSASGTITLSLSGEVFGPQSLGGPIDLTYTITGGTGAFQGATGSGKAVLTFQLPPTMRPMPTPLAASFVLSFGNAI
jgi:hypothetical protein